MARGLALGIAATIALALGSSSVAQEAPAGFEAYKQTMREAGFNALLPASGNFAPGYVYRLFEFEGRQYVETLCRNAFPAQPVPPTEIQLPGIDRVPERSLSAGLNLAPGALAPDLAAAFGSEIDAARPVEVSFGQMRLFEVARRNEFDSVAVKREIARGCLEKLKGLAGADGTFSERVYIVVSAVATDRFSYRLQQNAGEDVNLTAGLETPEPADAAAAQAAQRERDVESARIGWRVRRTGNATFEIVRDPAATDETQIFLAANVVRLEHWDVSTQVSSPSADLRVPRASRGEVDALGRQPPRYKPVLVDLVGAAPRESENGGNAVLLLSDDPRWAEANLTICRSLFARMDTRSMERLRIGIERDLAAGAMRALRPVYWLTQSPLGVQPTCDRRLGRYNWRRAGQIRYRLGIDSLAPQLVVLRSDHTTAGVLDLSNVLLAEYDKAVVLFRDGFSQEGAVWNPASYALGRRDGAINQAFEVVAAPRHIQAAMRILASPITNCRKDDPTDTSCGSPV